MAQVNWGALHPQVVHFVVALGLVGVALRIVSLTGRLAWTRAAGACLLILAALSAAVAQRTGHEAHGPVERIPGLPNAVGAHEDAGDMTRTLFLVVGAIELVGLALRKREQARRWVYAASALVGIAASYKLYQAADLGGKLVYAYAGGPGLRSGDTTDVRRLLVAGLFNQARAARTAGDTAEAARLTDELARQMPGDPGVRMLVIESMITDRHDPAGALAALDSLPTPDTSPRVAMQRGLLASRALVAMGQADSARQLLQGLSRKYPDSRMLKDAISRLPQ